MTLETDGIGIVVLSCLETNTPSGCCDLPSRYIGTLERQFRVTVSNVRTPEKDRFAEPSDGDTFGRPPYQEPEFTKLIKSEIVEPPPSYDGTLRRCSRTSNGGGSARRQLRKPSPAPSLPYETNQ